MQRIVLRCAATDADGCAFADICRDERQLRWAVINADGSMRKVKNRLSEFATACQMDCQDQGAIKGPLVRGQARRQRGDAPRNLDTFNSAGIRIGR